MTAYGQKSEFVKYGGEKKYYEHRGLILYDYSSSLNLSGRERYDAWATKLYLIYTIIHS